MDPIISQLIADLATVSAKNTASRIADKLKMNRSNRDKESQIAELRSMVYELLDEKSEAIEIARAFQQKLVSQSIDQDQIEFITGTVIPTLEKVLRDTNGAGDRQTIQMLEAIKSVLRPEMLQVMQILGFNYSEAIGQPLTKFIAHKIDHASTNAAAIADQQLASIELQTEVAKMVRSKAAYDRFRSLFPGVEQDD